MPRPERRETPPEQAALAGPTHRLLVEATIASIHRYGLCDTSVATITEIAGLSRGMVRHCFASKNAMLVAAYGKLRAEWTAAMFEDRGGTARERLVGVIDSMFAPPNFDPPKLSAWLAFSVAAHSDEDLREVNRATYADWHAGIEAAIARHAAETGEPVEAGRVAMTVLALSDGLWLQHMLDPERMPRALIRDLCVEALFALMPPETGA